MTEFSDFGLCAPISRALADEGHKIPTPIQTGAIPPLMVGRDLLGVAQTGTGKTAAFVLPILHRLAQTPRTNQRSACRVLVLTPTRELAAQVHERFNAYGRHLNLHAGLIIGGASINKQTAVTRSGVDILVATPGRLVDVIDRGALMLDKVETFVLDEVDQMLDLGFIHAIRALAAKLPSRRQNIFLSATIPPVIARLAASLLRDPVRVQIAAKEKLKIDQSVMFLETSQKSTALIDIAKGERFTRGLVFTRTKRGADKVVRLLNASGAPAFAIHGNRSQPQRERALHAFRTGAARILVATDIAARGLDISDVSHVVNFDMPNIPETYVHRIGRTARAGAAGIAISFCSHEERNYLRSIEKLTAQKIAVANDAGARPAIRQSAPNGQGKKKAPPPRRQQPALLPFLTEKASARAEEGKDHGERGTTRIRRRRYRGAAGRKLSRAAG